jgi:hypothetical protein
MTILVACGACARLVWSTESCCPFCGTATDRPVLQGSRTIVVRAAGVAAMVAAASCGGTAEVSQQAPVSDAAGDVAAADAGHDATAVQDVASEPDVVQDIVDVDVPEDWQPTPVYKGPPPQRA